MVAGGCHRVVIPTRTADFARDEETLKDMQVGAVDKVVQPARLVDGLGNGRPGVTTCTVCVAFGLDRLKELKEIDAFAWKSVGSVSFRNIGFVGPPQRCS